MAIRDIISGESVKAVFIDNLQIGYMITVRDNIPLGHKFALRDIGKGSTVIKYCRPIGYALVDISTGSHVHIHNIRSLRWGTRRVQREMI